MNMVSQIVYWLDLLGRMEEYFICSFLLNVEQFSPYIFMTG